MKRLKTIAIMWAVAAQAERGLAVTHSGADKRVALVIGNGNYQHAEIKLINIQVIVNKSN